MIQSWPAWRDLENIAKLLILITLAIYIPTLDYSYFADDSVYLGVRNNYLLSLKYFDLWRLLVEPGNPWEFLPIRDITYWADARIFGVYGESFHVGNMFWYCVCIISMYAAAYATFGLSEDDPAKRRILSAVATALFTAHPAHVEPVVWISGRKDVLATAFVLLAWAATINALKLRKNAVIAHIVSLFLLVLSVFSKSVATFSGGLVALYAFKSGGRRVAIVVILLISGAAAIHMNYAVQMGIRIENSPGAFVMIERASQVLASLIGIVFIPSELRVIRDVSALGSWHWGVTFIVLIVGLISFIAVLKDAGTVWAWAVLWIIVPLLPYLQVMPFSTWSMSSERFVTISTFGFSVGFVYFLAKLTARSALIIVLAVFISYSAVAKPRIDEWRYETDIWEKEAVLSPAYFNSVRVKVLALISTEDYSAAEKMIASIEHAGARTLMLQTMMLQRQEFRLRAVSPAEMEGVETQVCVSRLALISAIDSEFVGIVKEKNIAYNNFLRGLMNFINFNDNIRNRCSLHFG